MTTNNHFKYWSPRVSKTLTVPEITLYDNLTMTVKKYPNKIAFHYYGVSLTYKELLRQVDDPAAWYLENTQNVQKGERVYYLCKILPNI